MKKNLPIFAKFINERETTMLAQIPEAIREALARNTELRQKPEIKVLLSLGAGHTPLYMKKKSMIGNQIQRSFQEMPYIFDNFSTLIRKMMIKGKVTDAEIERAVLELEKEDNL